MSRSGCTDSLSFSVFARSIESIATRANGGALVLGMWLRLHGLSLSLSLTLSISLCATWTGFSNPAGLHAANCFPWLPVPPGHNYQQRPTFWGQCPGWHDGSWRSCWSVTNWLHLSLVSVRCVAAVLEEGVSHDWRDDVHGTCRDGQSSQPPSATAAPAVSATRLEVPESLSFRRPWQPRHQRRQPGPATSESIQGGGSQVLGGSPVWRVHNHMLCCCTAGMWRRSIEGVHGSPKLLLDIKAWVAQQGLDRSTSCFRRLRERKQKSTYFQPPYREDTSFLGLLVDQVTVTLMLKKSDA